MPHDAHRDQVLRQLQPPYKSQGQPSASTSSTKSHTSACSVDSQGPRGETAPSAAAGEDAVRAFLSSLGLGPDALLSLFVDDIGVTDGHALDGLGRMHGREAFLYSWVRSGKMTELQFAVLTRKFAEAYDRVDAPPPSASQAR